MAAIEDGQLMSREAYNDAKAEIAARNEGLRQAPVATSDEDEEDYEEEDSPQEDEASEGTGGLIQSMLAQAERQLEGGADGMDLPRVPPKDEQGVEGEKRLTVVLTPVQVPGPTKPTTPATSAHGRRVMLTRVPSNAPVLEGVTPAGLETVSQEEREDSMITGSLTKVDRKNSKRLAKEMTQSQAPGGSGG